jgi:hypothetical protein
MNATDELKNDAANGDLVTTIEWTNRATELAEDFDHVAAEVSRLSIANEELADAIRLTVEYIGTDFLPARAGWSWFDALSKHRPDMIPSVTS